MLYDCLSMCGRLNVRLTVWLRFTVARVGRERAITEGTLTITVTISSKHRAKWVSQSLAIATLAESKKKKKERKTRKQRKNEKTRKRSAQTICALWRILHDYRSRPKWLLNEFCLYYPALEVCEICGLLRNLYLS